MKAFYFYEAYKMASLVQESAKDPETFLEIPWDDPSVIRCLFSYSRVSVLHYYIAATIAVYYRREYRKDNDFIEEGDITVIEHAFSMYGVAHQPFGQFRSTADLEHCEEFRDEFYEWFISQEDAFMELWDHTTGEVFHLLFADRHFLLTFNKSLAEYLQGGEVKVPQEYLGSSGRLKRCRHIPAWAREAVFFRDRGRCVLCSCDLSGLLRTDFTKHIDHIVPLNQWGINDPCNLQLLCESCNLHKGATTSATSPRYSPWWEN